MSSVTAVPDSLIARIPVLIGNTDGHGVIQKVEGGLAGTLPDLSAPQASLPALFPDEVAEIRNALHEGSLHIETRRGDEQTPSWFDVWIVADRDAPGAHFLVQDVTETRLLQLALLDCTDREQIRVGQELHDTLGPELLGIAYRLEALLGQAPPSLSRDLAVLRERVSAAMQHTRDLAFTLSPHGVGGRVETAFGRLCSHVEGSFAVRCSFHAQLEEPISDDSTAFHLFRIAQEACTNAIRHASPHHIEMRLVTGAENLLEIADDGGGLPPEDEAFFPGMGISMMKFRTRALGGTLKFSRREPAGTVVRCRFQNKPAPDAAPTCPSCP
jgi:signal transduction histidine kinase